VPKSAHRIHRGDTLDKTVNTRYCNGLECMGIWVRCMGVMSWKLYGWNSLVYRCKTLADTQTHFGIEFVGVVVITIGQIKCRWCMG
jgi:hypothetical protein